MLLFGISVLHIYKSAKVEFDKNEFETEFSLIFSNKRDCNVSFRNLENQLEPFIEVLKKEIQGSLLRINYFENLQFN